MNFFDDRALNRRVMVSTGQGDHLFLSGERIDHQTLKFWRNDLVVFGEKENCRRMNSFRIRDAIEFAWNLQRHRSGQELKVPPAVVAQDYLAQWWRIVKNKTADFAVGRDVHCYRAPNTRAKRRSAGSRLSTSVHRRRQVRRATFASDVLGRSFRRSRDNSFPKFQRRVRRKRPRRAQPIVPRDRRCRRSAGRRRRHDCVVARAANAPSRFRVHQFGMEWSAARRHADQSIRRRKKD